MKKIFVFGNPDLPGDSLPMRLLPQLQKTFPQISFQTLDPNEEWAVPEELIVIDTAQGLKEIKVFDNLDSFASAPRVTMHDFDALTNLRLLQKLGKLKKIKIIGLPQSAKEDEILDEVATILKMLTKESSILSPN